MRKRSRTIALAVLLPAAAGCSAILGIDAFEEVACVSACGPDATAGEDAATPGADADPTTDSATAPDGATDGPTTTDGDAASPEATAPDADAGVPDDGGSPSDATSGGDGYTTLPDGGPICNPAETLGDAGVFTSSSKGSPGANCGSVDSPCSTIQRGLDKAAQQGRRVVYVGNGTYNETLTLKSGVSIVAGWTVTGSSSLQWARDCSGAPQSHVIVTGQAGVTASAVDLADPVDLDTLTLRSKTASTGESLIGLLVRGATTHVNLNLVTIEVGAAGAGATGGAGTGGATGGDGCATPGNGVAGSAGTLGTGAPQGSFASGGYAAASGQAGGPGGLGSNGAGGSMPSCLGCLSCAVSDCAATTLPDSWDPLESTCRHASLSIL